MGAAELEPISGHEVVRAPAPLDALHAVRLAVASLDDQRQALVAARDVDRLAYGAADVALIADELATIARTVKRDIAIIMDEDHEAAGGSPKRNPKREVPGLGLVAVEGGREWKNWESSKLLRRLLLQAITTEDGEIRDLSPLEMVDAIQTVLEATLPITASLGWRTGQYDKANDTWSGLRGQHVDPEDYGEFTEKPRMAKIPKRNPNTDQGDHR